MASQLHPHIIVRQIMHPVHTAPHTHDSLITLYGYLCYYLLFSVSFPDIYFFEPYFDGHSNQ